MRQLADESHALVQAARLVLDQLTRAIAGVRYFAMLTNARGVVIDVRGAVMARPAQPADRAGGGGYL